MGHYVCNECHTQGMDSVVGICLAETSKNPVEIIQKMMALPFCHMHGPEHHVMVGSALLTAYKNAGGDIDLPKALSEMQGNTSAWKWSLARSNVCTRNRIISVSVRGVRFSLITAKKTSWLCKNADVTKSIVTIP